MSHIFDALQRSEAERTGTELPLLEATELLEIAEQTVTKPVIPIESDEATQQEVASPAEFPALGASAEIPTQDADADQFYLFQSVRLLAPPQSRLVCLTDKESLAAEKFRYLTVRLRQVQQKRLLKKVLITSTIPQEGKSMVSANLACALARKTQHKTLLLDGDLRRPSLGQLFGLDKLPGLSDWLRGEHDPARCIYHLDDPSLWILPAGNVPTNPLELMQSGSFSAVMDRLSRWFDCLIIDSPPVLPLGDTSIWMRVADGILLVTRQGISEKQQLRKGLEAIDSSKLIGAILNGATTPAHNNYYYLYSRPKAK